MESPFKKRRIFTPGRVNNNEKSYTHIRHLMNKTDRCEINNESDLLLSLTSQFGLQFPILAIQAINHVPAKFPNRLMYVSNIMKVLDVDCSDIDLNHILKQLDSIVKTDFGIVPEETLWNVTLTTHTPHLGFLISKADTCMVNGCGGNLFASAKDTTAVTVFTLKGPVPYLKTVLKCKNCCTRHGIDKFHLPHGSSFMYPDELQPDVVMASNRVFFSRDAFELLCESGNHAFVSAQAFAEIYNSTFHSKHLSVTRFREWQKRAFEAQDKDADTTRIMTNKIALEAMFNGELENEMRTRNLISTIGLKVDSDRERIMQTIDEMRRGELYPHDASDCNEDCRRKGCQNLRVIDGCWKLCIPHCMMAVRTEVNGYPLVNFPNVCVKAPKAGSVFCDEHMECLTKHGIPTDKKAFLKHIGCKDNPSTQEDIKRVDDRVLQLHETLQDADDNVGTSAMTYQGTETIIQGMPMSTLTGKDKQPVCNKDTGEKGRLRQRARGHFVAVSGGGNILYFNPLYKSESPSQVFMIVVRMLYMEMKDVPPEELDKRLQEYILCYDNMCHLVDDLLPAAPVRRGTETAATPATPPRAPATPPRKSGSPLREPAADRYKSAATPATPPQAPAPTPRKRGSPLRAPAADQYKSAATPPQAPAPTPRKRGSHLREPAADQYKSAATPATPPRAPAPTPRKRGSHLRAPAADQYKSAATPATPPRAPDTPPRESGSPLREPAADQYKSAATPATPPRAPATPPRESGSPLREPAADRYKSAATPATPPQAPAPTPLERGSPLRAPAADQYKSASSLDTKLSLPPKPHSTKFIPNLPVPRRASRKASTKEKPKLWCSCRTTSTRGKMIGCDSDNCKIEWYHMKCLKMKKAPLAEWICPNCNIK